MNKIIDAIKRDFKFNKINEEEDKLKELNKKLFPNKGELSIDGQLEMYKARERLKKIKEELKTDYEKTLELFVVKMREHIGSVEIQEFFRSECGAEDVHFGLEVLSDRLILYFYESDFEKNNEISFSITKFEFEKRILKSDYSERNKFMAELILDAVKIFKKQGKIE